MGFLDRLSGGASWLWEGTKGVASSVGSTLGEVASGAYETVTDSAASIYHTGVDAANAASGYVHRGEEAVTDGAHWMEDKVDAGTHDLASYAKRVPVLGSVAETVADAATFGTQVLGGAVGGASSLIGGVANSALHPIDTVVGLETMGEHVPGIGSGLKAVHGLLDVAIGDASLDDVENRLDPEQSLKDDGHYWGNVAAGIAAPYRQSIAEGRPGEVVGRGAFDIATLLSGAGVAESATTKMSSVIRATEGADVARGAEISDASRATELSHGGHEVVGSSQSRAAEAGSEAAVPEQKAISDSRRNTSALSPEEIEQAKAKATELGMPPDKIDLRFDDAKERTSWGQVFGRERMTIADDVKPALPRQTASGEWEHLTPNQRVSMDGAISHEVVGHREADLAGRSQTRGYEHYSSLDPGERASQLKADAARDEAQASLRAAKFSPGLANKARKTLFQDAMSRLEKIGLGVDDVPGMNLFLEHR